MYYPSQKEFEGCDKRRLSAFVNYWDKLWKPSVRIHGTKSLISYQDELNLGHDLTERNVTRLLRWKYQRKLTHPHVNGHPNATVIKVLARRKQINEFRNGAISQTQFAAVTNELFPTGVVFQAFLFHIAKPGAWPIADQHVFRAAKKLFRIAVPKNLNEFEVYREQFSTLASSLRLKGCIDETDAIAAVMCNKRLDNALMMFGAFLAKYDLK